MAQEMHKMRLGRSLASLIGEGEGSEFEVEGQRNVALDAIKAGRFNPRRNFSEAQIEELAVSIRERGLVVASVLSGNRNFEGRIQQEVRANYLASPPLVVAYALAGSMKLTRSSPANGAGARRSAPICTRFRSSSARCRTKRRSRSPSSRMSSARTSTPWRRLKATGS